MAGPKNYEVVDKGATRASVSDIYASPINDGESCVIIVEMEAIGQPKAFRLEFTVWLTEKAWPAIGMPGLAACGWDAAENNFDIEGLLRDKPIVGSEVDVRWELQRRVMIDKETGVPKVDQDGNERIIDQFVVTGFAGRGRKRLDVGQEASILRNISSQLRMWSGVTSASPNKGKKPSAGSFRRPAAAPARGAPPAAASADANDDDIPF